MDFRFSQFEILTGAGTLLVCIFFVCVFSEVSDIENELGTAVTSAVETKDLYWSGVEVNGQHVVLTGAAPDVPAQRSAQARAEAIWGVSGVENLIEVIGQDGTCQRQIDEYLDREAIQFKSGKADVTDASHHVIGMLAMILRTCDATVEIAGHTDDKGGAEVNLRLSQRRADTVARHLAAHGVAAERLLPVGYGEKQPVASNATEDGRRENRRIEFRVLGGTA